MLFITIVTWHAFEILLIIPHPVLLLLLSFILNLIILYFSSTESSFHSNWASATCFECCSSSCHKTPKFHQIAIILESLHRLKIDERFQYKVLSYTYVAIHSLIILRIFLLFLVLNAIVLHAHLLWSNLNVLPLIIASKWALFIILLLFSGTVFLLTYVIHHLTLYLILIHLYFPFLLMAFSKD
jgi:hypothetical protein